MEPRQQCKQFACELEALIRRTIDEYNLNYYEIVGIMHMAAFELQAEAFNRGDDEGDDEPPTEDDLKDLNNDN